MPYFLVMMRGEDILLPSEGASEPIVGFYTTRLVKAASSEVAQHKAQAMLSAEWESGQYVELNKGRRPRISIESVRETTFIHSLRFKNSGHTFYTGESGA